MVASLFICFEIFFEQIGEEKQFEHKKQYKKFNDNYCPKGFTYCHAFKAIVVKVKCFFKEIFNHIDSISSLSKIGFLLICVYSQFLRNTKN